MEKNGLVWLEVDIWELYVCNGGGCAWYVLVYGLVEWGGFCTLGCVLGLDWCGGMGIWVVTMVDGVEDDGMVCEIIGVVEGEMEFYLLLFVWKLGSIMIPFCMYVLGMEDRSKVGGTQKVWIWGWLLVGGWLVAKELAWLETCLGLRTFNIASSFSNTYFSISSIGSSCVGSIIGWVTTGIECLGSSRTCRV